MTRATVDYVLTIEYAPGDASLDDAVQAILFLSSTQGSTIGERDGRTVVESYFATAAERDAAAEMLRGAAAVSTRLDERPRADWLQLYRQSLTPIPIGRRIVVVPDASIETDDSRVRIVIPQERAFGTGSHESTALCIELLEDLNPARKRCLDVGTGSGILAITMALLGAKRVAAFDNDFETFGVIQRNLARNQVRILAFYGELTALRGTSFDIITMNIIPEVIGPLLPHVRMFMNPGSRLIVSGITIDRRGGFMERAEAAGLTIDTEKTKNDWWAAVLRLH